VAALLLIVFNKPTLSQPDQLQILVSIGLKTAARHSLARIGDKRLSGYALPFQIGGTGPDRCNFKFGVSF
jgi:hypothetical protein